nr:DUF1120 domain-containing protein [uncultured Pseudomonas sp.]
MNTSFNTLITTLLMAAAGNAIAASSVDLSVRGSITPSACELSFANGGDFDLGKIAAKDLSMDLPTELAAQATELTVTCEAATLVAVESKDNRAGSAYYDHVNAFGLGLINGNQKLGNLYAAIRNVVADGAKAYGLHSMDGGLTWKPGGYFKPGNLVSAYPGNPAVPMPIQRLTAQVTLSPFITAAKDLTLTDEVAIDGSVTMTVKYL